ncbi:MAG TPA: hypothetical protein VJN21_13330 [Candidatus Acidoferrales bacterium]|nr:hypothetical protein [Candidatus Acidoferrales bacterium]
MRTTTQEATLPRCLLAAGESAYIASFPSRSGPVRGGPVASRAPNVRATTGKRTPRDAAE